MSDVSSVVNYFPTVNEGFTTTVGVGGVLSAGTAIPLTSTSGLTNGSIFVGIIEPGEVKEQTFTGTVDVGGSQITGVKWTRGTNVDHLAGAAIVDYVTGTAVNMMDKGILTVISQTGGLKSGLAIPTPTITTPVLQGTVDGWIGANESWTYASATTITVPSDATTKYDVGDYIKLTQSAAIKYFVVTAVATTLLTVVGLAGVTVANAAITLPAYSKQTPHLLSQDWQTWTPTYTNISVGNGTALAHYRRYGKLVIVRFVFVLGSTSTIGTAPTFTLPVEAAAIYSATNKIQVGTGFADDNGVAGYQLAISLRATTTPTIEAMTANTTYVNQVPVTSSVPFGWGTTDSMTMTFMYEAL